MDNSLYVGLSQQIVLQRQMDIVANNIANADTSGFKVEQLAVAEDPQAPAFTLGGPAPVKFVMPNGVIRDFGQGAANYDANGHYARIQPIFNTFSFADNPTGGTLTPIPNSQRPPLRMSSVCTARAAVNGWRSPRL